MSQNLIMERNLQWLHRRRIVTRKDPEEKPTVETPVYKYYEEGTHGAYDLFKSTAKINTFRSLKWHLLVLWYLNPNLSMDDFQEICIFIADKQNGFCTFNINLDLLYRIMHDVSMQDLEEPPKNRMRKVIFKQGSGLSKSEKLKIVGELIGRSKKIHSDDIYQCMIDIHDMGQKITIQRVSDVLGCTPRTIHRNMCHELKKEKELLNNSLRR